MTVVHVEQGYLQPPYLIGEYSAVQVLGAMGTQFQAVINYEVALAAQFQGVIAKATAVATQFQAIITSPTGTGAQFEGDIIDRLSALGTEFESTIPDETAVGVEFEGFIGDIQGIGVQYRAEIIDRLSALATQFEGTIIDALAATGLQSEGIIAKAHGVATQFQAIIFELTAGGVQFSADILDRLNSLATEFEAIISTVAALGIQFEGVIQDSIATGVQFNSEPFEKRATGTQFEGHINDALKPMASQFIMAPYVHIWSNYLVEDYLVGTYLSKNFHVHCGLQFEARATEYNGLAFQFQGIIQGYQTFATQFEGVIQSYKPTAVQFTSINPTPLGVQFRSALYNTDNLRILWEFPSRGTGGGTNWTATSTYAGDFNVSNVNTDIVEQVWRSQAGAITGVKLVCDTGLPQGVFLDTFAMLNHNLTTSASVLLEGDDDPAFGSPGFSELLQISADNTYWISPTLPLAGFRYWRLSIDDPTQTEGYLEIGTIIFGESVIFVGECFSNPLRMKKTHYSDKVFTEGFTNVSNDRTLKKSIGLTFANLIISGGNYENLTEIFNSARTNLKCLWIPTPKYPERYAVFGKLAGLPDEEHNDLGQGADYVNLSVEIDESL